MMACGSACFAGQVQAAQFRLSGSPIRAGSGPGCAPSPAPPARTCTCNRRCRRSAAAAAARSRHGRRPRLNTHHASVSVVYELRVDKSNLRTSSAELLQAPTFRSKGMEPAVGKLSWIRRSTAEASVVDQPPPDRPSITNFSLRNQAAQNVCVSCQASGGTERSCKPTIRVSGRS